LAGPQRFAHPAACAGVTGECGAELRDEPVLARSMVSATRGWRYILKLRKAFRAATSFSIVQNAPSAAAYDGARRRRSRGALHVAGRCLVQDVADQSAHQAVHHLADEAAQFEPVEAALQSPTKPPASGASPQLVNAEQAGAQPVIDVVMT